MSDIKMRWNKVKAGLVNSAEWIVVVTSTIVLLYVSMLVWGFRFNSEDSWPIKTRIIYHMLLVVIIPFGVWLVGICLNRYSRFCEICSALLLVLGLCLLTQGLFSFVNQLLILPTSDPKSCYDIAVRFYNSEFGAVVPRDSYLSLWPFQTGFIFILEKTMRYYADISPLIFQETNCRYIIMIVVSGFGSVCALTKRIDARLLYTFLMLSYLPLHFSVVVIYGDVPALAWMSFATMCFVFYNYFLNKLVKVVCLILCCGSCVIACTYKRNALIFVIALLLIVLVMQIRECRLWVLILVLISVIGASVSCSLTQRYYEHYAGEICGKGVPTVAYLAMALQYNGEEPIPGGWNGFHSNTYIETGYDYEQTVSLSRESIDVALQTFKSSPDFMLYFFHNKVLKQWANQTHGVFWGDFARYDDTRDSQARWVIFIENKEYNAMLSFMDLHESVVYIVLVIAAIILLVRKISGEHVEIWKLLGFVTFIGGFLFSLIWEGQTGAVLYYPILLLPIALSIVYGPHEYK